MRISEAWEKYKQDKRMMGYSKHTLKAYKIQTRLLAEALGDPEIEEVAYDDLKRYLYAQTHLKPSSMGHRVRFIRSLFRWAVDEGYITKNPAAKLKEPKEGKRVPKFLSEEDIETIRAACVKPIEYVIIELLYTTGCRIGEIQKINVSDIDWGNQSIVVDGKGSVEREVYFHTKCKVWMRKYLDARMDNDPALIVTERSPHRMSIAQIRYIVKRVSKRAEVEANVYPHRLRHTYATHLLNNGAPIEAIQQLLGHAKSETTSIYCQMTGQRRKEIYKRYF